MDSGNKKKTKTFDFSNNKEKVNLELNGETVETMMKSLKQQRENLKKAMDDLKSVAANIKK